MMDKHAILKLHQFFKELMRVNPDKVIEEQIGILMDSAVHDLYWSNSIFSSDEFCEIVEELEKKNNKTLVVPDIKKRLFREILRNLICMSRSKSNEGHFYVAHILPIYILHALYIKNLLSIVNSTDILYNDKQQLSFLNSLVCTYNFPSQYDNKCKLLSFAKECANMSNFVRNKGSGAAIMKSKREENPCNATSLPNSIDKIIETISKVLESEKTDLNSTEQNILDDIDKEINGLL